jgi:hypothetical protein
MKGGDRQEQAEIGDGLLQKTKGGKELFLSPYSKKRRFV